MQKIDAPGSTDGQLLRGAAKPTGSVSVLAGIKPQGYLRAEGIDGES